MNPLFIIVTDDFIVPVSQIFVFKNLTKSSQLNVRTPSDHNFNVYQGSYENCQKLLRNISLEDRLLFMRGEDIQKIFKKIIDKE